MLEAFDPFPEGSDDVAPDPAALQPGDFVLGVMLVAPIGAGNVARVWSGFDGETPVAVKIFDPARRGDPAARAAFARGARAMTRLAGAAGRPPSILPLHRSTEDGLALVTGIAENTAEDLCALGWPAERIVPFFMQLCRAIEFAHRTGVAHRCLKPSNVLVTDDLEPLVGDFDLVDLPSLAKEDPTAGGYAPYAAPEELSGMGVGAPTADVYSLGRMLYFLLHGADPDEPVADQPALFPLAGQPQGLVRIIRKCTLREPSGRYQEVGALLWDLERYERAELVGVAGPVFDPPASRRGELGGASPSMRPGPLSAPAPQTLPPPSRRGAGAASIPPAPLSSRGAGAKGASIPPGPASSRSVPPASMRPGPPSSRAGSVAPPSRRTLRPPPLLPEEPLPDEPGVDSEPASPRWLSRRAERIAAASGVFVWVALAAAVARTAIPSEDLLDVVRGGAAAGAALATLALPRFRRRLVAARVIFAALAGVLVHAADPSSLAALRLEATLSSPDPVARAAAVRRLADSGRRGFDGRDLSGLDLAGADLSLASFRGASLARADLTEAALSESSFDGADLTDAIALGADLSESGAHMARGWRSVQCDEETLLPAGWACADGRPARDAGAEEGGSR